VSQMRRLSESINWKVRSARLEVRNCIKNNGSVNNFVLSAFPDQ